MHPFLLADFERTWKKKKKVIIPVGIKGISFIQWCVYHIFNKDNLNLKIAKHNAPGLHANLDGMSDLYG